MVDGAAREFLLGAYRAYNAQDLDGLLGLIGDEVDWPDGPNRLRGKAAVAQYWAEQWTRTHTHDQPVDFRWSPDGRVTVEIRQVVRSLDGSVLSAGFFRHTHRIVGRQIVRLDIEEVHTMK